MYSKLQTFAVTILLSCSIGAGADKQHAKKEREILPGTPACTTEAKCELYFSPGGGCTDRIVKEIGAAKKEILVLAYSFTSDPIAKALAKAKSRGVDVAAIIDSARIGEKSGDAYNMAEAGVEVYSDGSHSIQHQKVMIIDPGEDTATVIMGSFNFTAGAEHGNSENIMVIKNKDVSIAFEKNWEHHKEHSKKCAWEDKPSAAGIELGKAISLCLAAVVCFYLLVLLRRKLFSRRK